jgi:predicted PurR-regulated permease PerM
MEEQTWTQDAGHIEQASAWIRTFSLVIIAVVALGAGLIYLKFILEPLVLARFCVYIFQPFINYMVGKKGFWGTNLRLRIPRPVAVFICAIIVICCAIILGGIIYYSGKIFMVYFVFKIYLIIDIVDVYV